MQGTCLAIGTAMSLRIYQEVDLTEGGSAYLPVGSHFTGPVGVHDLCFDQDNRLWFVNTRFSALCTIDLETHFNVMWRPAFIQDFKAEDACHLNGMALADGRPAVVTALAVSDRTEGWRSSVPDSGVLMGIDQTIICRDLSLPHSPHVIDSDVWFLESGKGLLRKASLATGDIETVYGMPGVLRGLAFAGPYVFVGLSKTRRDSGSVTDTLSTRLSDFPTARVLAIEAESGVELGYAELPAVDEISSLAIVPKSSAKLLSPSPSELESTIVYRDFERQTEGT